MTEWAKREGISPDNARQKANRGTIPAKKIGRDWFINDSYKNKDARVKSGKYKNWRKGGVSN